MTDDHTMPETSSQPHAAEGVLARVGAGVLRNRRLMRAPIWLFRARLGFLFRYRMLLLEHIGRKSGARRYVVLEVFDRPTPKAYVVISGLGNGAQWFRNVRANPHVRVSVSRHARAHATARVLTADEAAEALDAYTARHPRA